MQKCLYLALSFCGNKKEFVDHSNTLWFGTNFVVEQKYCGWANNFVVDFKLFAVRLKSFVSCVFFNTEKSIFGVQTTKHF